MPADRTTDTRSAAACALRRNTRVLHGLFALFALCSSGAALAAESTVYTFHGSDGRDPAGQLARDSQGNLYGVTWSSLASCSQGYLGRCGTIFELSPPQAGGAGWTRTTLHTLADTEGGLP